MNIKHKIISFIKDYQTNLTMIFSVIIGVLLILLIEGWQPYQLRGPKDFIDSEIAPPPSRHSPLSAEEKEWAISAWRFFENNVVPETGLINSVENYPMTTMWDTASYLFALIATQKLEIIDNKTFSLRLNEVLVTLSKLPLFDNKLPHKAYNTKTLKMIDYNDPSVEKHLGWSALDIARILIPLHYITWSFPEYAPLIQQIIGRWDLNALSQNGELSGASNMNNKLHIIQEGRLGYEQYAAKSLMLYGLDTIKSSEYNTNLKFKKIEGVYIPTDIRTPKTHHAQNYILSEPFILDGIEFGWDTYSKNLAYRVYQAQVARFKNQGIYTAVTEDNIDKAPYFVYNAVYINGKAWQTVSDTGVTIPDAKTVSSKAAIGWYVLYNDEYTTQLVQHVTKARTSDKGWFAGIYEKDNKVNAILTANTNGIILEALYFKQFGSFLQNAYKSQSNHE
jgi:hypothetical protein